MDPRRINALAELISCIRRDQEADGFDQLFIGPEDKISLTDADVIVAALKAYALSNSQIEAEK